MGVDCVAFCQRRRIIFRGRGEGACAGMVKMRTLVLVGDDNVARREEKNSELMPLHQRRHLPVTMKVQYCEKLRGMMQKFEMFEIL